MPTLEEGYIRITDFSDPSSIRFDDVRVLHVITFDSEESSRSNTYCSSIRGDL